jgi:hypothetical protein
MRLARIVLASALAAAAAPASAQLSNRSIAVESGLSTSLRGGAPAAAALALSATTWLDGELEAIARVSLRAGPRTDDRGADAMSGIGWSGTAGLRLSLLPEPFRPQLSVELGWARVEGPSGPSDRLALGAGLGVEWFPVRDVSVSARCAARVAGDTPSLELVLGAAAYF